MLFSSLDFGSFVILRGTKNARAGMIMENGSGDTFVVEESPPPEAPCEEDSFSSSRLEQRPCHFGAACYRTDCIFAHPPTRTLLLRHSPPPDSGLPAHAPQSPAKLPPPHNGVPHRAARLLSPNPPAAVTQPPTARQTHNVRTYQSSEGYVGQPVAYGGQQQQQQPHEGEPQFVLRHYDSGHTFPTSRQYDNGLSHARQYVTLRA